MCIKYKDCVYNCWEINVWSLILIFKCCKMLLEDEGDESTWHHRACLLKYYLRRPCAPSFVKSRMLYPLQKHFLLFNKYSLYLYVYTRGVLGCLLGVWPLLCMCEFLANCEVTWGSQILAKFFCLPFFVPSCFQVYKKKNSMATIQPAWLKSEAWSMKLQVILHTYLAKQSQDLVHLTYL